MKSIVKLNEFFSVGIKLLEQAQTVISATRKAQGFTGISKGTMGSDVFTLADMHIQNTVKYNLKQIYPRAKIIGEEDEIGDFDTGEPYIWPD
jgi:fructose-1,6-bisphosphatase/inositol monophosphatase family enzyme